MPRMQKTSREGRCTRKQEKSCTFTNKACYQKADEAQGYILSIRLEYLETILLSTRYNPTYHTDIMEHHRKEAHLEYSHYYILV